MDENESVIDARIQRMRPILRTIAEAWMPPKLRSDLDASDLVQHTLLEAHQSADLLARLNEPQFSAWLHTALRHNFLDAVRRVNVLKSKGVGPISVSELEDSCLRLEELLVANDTSPSEVLERNEQSLRLLEAMQTLPERQRQAIIQKHLRGASLKQVAESLEISESAAAGLLHRGRMALVAILEKPES
ncbi:MAG: sigma-70 family RNA polymerase sigma factor [Pirellula sp.]|jgi:RNA polymerase sigma-70 factor (ECF subfamily)|nr:sigma-70 family RNA polymerase sigma factor [Pirellula sp.]